MCVVREVSCCEMRNMWSGEGPASSPNSPVVLFLEFWSAGISNHFTLGVGHLPPASNPTKIPNLWSRGNRESGW